jgi:hypothetical protein
VRPEPGILRDDKRVAKDSRFAHHFGVGYTLHRDKNELADIVQQTCRESCRLEHLDAFGEDGGYHCRRYRVPPKLVCV